MAYTAHTFSRWINALGTKQVNVTTDPLRVILLTAATTGLITIQDSAATMTDIKAATGFTELATGVGGSNYTQNANSHLSGQALAGVTWTLTGHGYVLSCTAPVWTTAAAAFNPAYAVFFDDIGGTDATNFPICYWDFGGAQLGTGGSYTLTVPAGGIWSDTGA